VRLWDVATGKVLAGAFGHLAGCRRIVYSPDGALIATASEDGTVKLWKGNDLTQVASVNLELPAYSVAFSPDGKLLAVGTGDWKAKKNGKITLLDPQTGERVKSLEGSDGLIFHLQFLKNGRLLAANAGAGVGAGSGAGGAAVWNVEDGRVEETYQTEGSARWVEISRDEKQVVATHGGSVSVWNRGESAPLATFAASDKFVHCAAFSPDGKQLAVGDEASTLSIWELRDTPASAVAESTKVE
jgi:WD40 repeat protein